SAYSNAYVLVAADSAACFLPHSLSVSGLDFEISKTSKPGAMPGSQRYDLSWREKGWTGDGLVEINPASTRTSELHIELREPRGWMSKLFFATSRLNQPAWDLSDGIRSKIEVAAGRRTRTEPAKAKKPRVALKPAVPATESMEFLSRL
ncbi:MAG: hypothetical protein ACRD1T_17030, partial [Acidimicrobiia bacterium]